MGGGFVLDKSAEFLGGRILISATLVQWRAGRAAALTGGGFVAGTLIGALLQSWLQVDIVPLGVSHFLPPVVFYVFRPGACPHPVPESRWCCGRRSL